MIYHEVIRKTWWTLKLDKVLINGENSGICDIETECEIIMDTGASLMASPPLLYEPLIEKITKNTSCDDWSTFPTIGFMIDG